MTLTFVTNLVHHHQLPVADEFYSHLVKDYHYIATEPLPDWLIKGGYDPSLDRPYITRTYSSDEEMAKARKFIDESDVVIVGDAPVDWAKHRMKEGKVTFFYSERIFRNGVPWLHLPKTAITHYLKYGRYKHAYMLCASAFTASDYAKTGCFIGKTFKWGYMTAVENFVEASPRMFPQKEPTPLMWCARFLLLKHPDLPVMLAERLKKKGYSFVINMFGSGEQFDNTKALINRLGVEDCVNLCGNRPNPEILQAMRHHAIFLFTSDRYEGWGAVLNESMANGCVPVASDAIGSVPYLIKNGINGLTFHSCDIDSLEQSVCTLLDNPERIESMSKEALNTMRNVWSPKVAASNFLDLAEHVLAGKLREYKREEGPASWEWSYHRKS